MELKFNSCVFFYVANASVSCKCSKYLEADMKMQICFPSICQIQMKSSVTFAMHLKGTEKVSETS